MTFSLRDIPRDERPRERLFAYGPSALSLTELLALLLGSGSPRQSVVGMAQAVVAAFDTLSELRGASLQQFCAIPGVGRSKASALVACMELARRISLDAPQYTAIDSPFAASCIARAMLVDIHKEHGFVLSLDAHHRLIQVDIFSVGILNASLVHPRELFSVAVKRHAAAIMLCHNHPSGDLDPSEEDMELTDRIHAAGRIMGIPLVDHIIINQHSFMSMREAGLCN